MIVTETDTAYVRRAIDLAYAAVENGQRPFAAILVAKDGEVLIEDCNIAVRTGDPLNHAEMNVLRSAHLRHGVALMLGSSLYVNGEPCTMCAGAILRYGIARLIFALREPDVSPYMMAGNAVNYPSDRIYAMAAGRMEVASDILHDYAKRPFELYVAKGRY